MKSHTNAALTYVYNLIMKSNGLRVYEGPRNVRDSLLQINYASVMQSDRSQLAQEAPRTFCSPTPRISIRGSNVNY